MAPLNVTDSGRQALNRSDILPALQIFYDSSNLQSTSVFSSLFSQQRREYLEFISMVQFYDSISEGLKAWALEQSVFFVASAPLAGSHVNVSPKGLPASSLSIFSPNQVAYVDYNGSGCETISHVYENGRVTLMFCSFEASPRIMRFFCKGTVVEWNQPGFDTLLTKMGFKTIEGARAIILLYVFKAQTSCGYGVPRLTNRRNEVGDTKDLAVEFEDRETLGNWASNVIKKGEMHDYRKKKNSGSLDRLPGLRTARKSNGETLWLTDLEAWLRRIMLQREAMLCGFLLASFMFLVVYVMKISSLRLWLDNMAHKSSYLGK